MKPKISIFSLLMVWPLQMTFSQDPTIGDAIEQPELIWTVETLRADTLEPLVVGPENLWSVVTEGTSDGVDALTVKAPEFQPAIARISTTSNGPFILKFKTRTDFQTNQSQLEYLLIDSEVSPPPFYNTLESSENWKEHTVAIIRDTQSFELTIQIAFSGDQNAQAWLDEVEIIREFPPTIQGSLPETFGIPLNKAAKLGGSGFGAVGYGPVRYQWFKDEAEIPGATSATIDFPAQSTAIDTSSYRLEISDDLGTAILSPVDVFYFDPNEALDNTELVFTFPDLESLDYSDMFLTGTDAPDGIDALRLARDRFSPFKTVTFIEAKVNGPTILSFAGNAAITLNGISPEGRISNFENDNQLNYIPIRNSLENTVRFLYSGNPYDSSSFSIVDSVTLSPTPLLMGQPIDQPTVIGMDKNLKFDSVSLGTTILELIKNDQVFLSSSDASISLETLTENDSGTYQLRLNASIGGSVTSEPFEIQIYPTIGDAVEQPNLEWIYEGEKIWIPQIFETYDGDDAAALLDEGEGTGSVSTTIDGPAFVSFWYKNATGFTLNESAAGLEDPTGNWQKAEIALTSGSNNLTWRTGFFDRLQIEYVDSIGEAVEQPDLEWTYAGNRIWIPQTDESHDGLDAAALVNDGEGIGTVATAVEGPSLVSFWWKDGGTFELNDEVIAYEGDGWQLVQQVAWKASNPLLWDAGYFDQLEIESLKDDPFRLWAFEKFPTDQVVADLEAIAEDDRDYDELNNLIEWALNKNLDFPNMSLGYKLIQADGGTYLGLTFSRPADLGAFIIRLESSADLTNWETIEAVVSETFNASNETYTVTIRDIQEWNMKSGRFVRLIVSDEG